MRTEGPNPLSVFCERSLTRGRRRHHLDGRRHSPTYSPTPSLTSLGVASVVMCCSARPASLSAPSVPPEDRIVRNIIHIRRFCDPSYFQPDLSPTHSPTPPPSQWPALTSLPPSAKFIPSAKLASFSAACVKLCGLPPPSLDRTTVATVSSSLQYREYKVHFEVNMNVKPLTILSDKVDAFTAKVAV